jgi:hypothetical protein
VITAASCKNVTPIEATVTLEKLSSAHCRGVALVVNEAKSWQVSGVMHTLGRKTQQQAEGKRLREVWSDLLLSFSTGFVHDPVSARRMINRREE